MSDEESEPRWFPRELRDYWSASVVEMLAELTIIAAIAVAISSVGTGRPQIPDADLPWSAIALVMASGVGTFICLPSTLIMLDVTTRYRQLGQLVPYSTAVLILCCLVTLGPGVNDRYAFVNLSYCLCLAISSGQYTRRPKFSPAPLMRGGERQSHFLGLLAKYWWFKRAIVTANAGAVLLVLPLTKGTSIGELVGVFLPWYLFLLSAALCVWCWLRLFRPFFELCVEPVFRVLYRMRASGPGVKQFPPFGPVLVIANHASWFDPLFLAKFIPRPITPMMTESFYKIWFLRPLLKNVFRVIVVRESGARREAPELQQAIDALDRGECVVLFPEGFLQRKADVELRRFARGVWHILAARPDTPVVSCFIAGGWLTKFSWRNGPPGKNKRMDFRTPIRVGVSLPETVPAEILLDQLTTRIHLMNRVNAARTHVGLEPLPTFELPRAVEEDRQAAQAE